MAISFVYPSFARKTSADWLIGATSISFAVWASVDDILAPAENQYLFSHRGASGQYSLRLNNSGKLRFSVTHTGGIYVTKDSTTTPV